MVMPIAGGIAIATRRDGAPGDVSQPQGFFDGVISDSAQQAWTQYRPELQKFLLGQLGLGDLIAKGVTLYDITLNLPEHVAPSVERDDNGDLIVHVVTDGCYLEATSTTPTDLGSWADPRLSVAFALDLTYRIDLPPTNVPLNSTGFEQVHVLNPVLDSHNFVADVGFMINDIIGFFSGTDYVRIIESYVAGTDFAPYVNNALAPVNAELARLADEGYWFLEALVDRLDGGSGTLHGLSVPGAPADRLDLLLTAVGCDLSGSMEGEISWPRSLGAPITHTEARSRRTAVRSLAQLGAVAAAQTAEQTKSWTIAQASKQIDLTAGTVVAPATGGQDVASRSEESGLVSVEAATSVAALLEKMPEGERATAAKELRAGSAERFTALVGGTAMFAALQLEFLRGRNDFQIPVTVAVGGQGLFPEEHPVGKLSSLWADDDDTTCRRRFLLVDVPIDQELRVQCQLDPDYEWSGSVAEVVCKQSGWDGTVTIHHAPRAVSLSEALSGQVEIRLADKGRVFHQKSDLEDRGIIFVGGRENLGQDADLNPQPLPPKGVVRIQDRVSPVALNPQPLPPKSDVDLREVAPAVVSQNIAVGAAAQSYQVEGHASRRWGSLVAGVDDRASAVVIAMTRHNPTGLGAVRGIDFTVEEYVALIVR